LGYLGILFTCNIRQARVVRYDKPMQKPIPQTNETPHQAVLRLYAAADWRSRWHAIQHAAYYGQAAVPDLIAALAADSVVVRRAAAQSLALIGPVARLAAQPLLQLLFDTDPDARADAAQALARITPPLKFAVPLLVGRLAAEENRTAQRWLLRIVGNIGSAAHTALPAIYRGLEDQYLFADALYALRSIAPTDPTLLRLLHEQLSTPHAPFQSLAAETVGKLRLATPEWVAALEAGCGSANANTRHAAQHALRKIRRAS
jgi:HEAT repeat protein